MDGGTIWDVDIISAVQQCLNVVDNEEDIIVDVAICGDSTQSQEKEASMDAIYNWYRSDQMRKFNRDSNSIPW